MPMSWENEGVETEKQRERGVFSGNKWFNSYKEGLKQEKNFYQS